MPIAAYSPAELEKAKDILSRTGPREIHDQYLVGNMTSGDRRAALTAWSQAKRALDTQGGPTGVGEVDAYIKGVVEQYQKIWGVDARGRTGVDVVQALMLAVQVLGALDIPGDLVERKALQYGASPGLAYLMNWAVWIPDFLNKVETEDEDGFKYREEWWTKQVTYIPIKTLEQAKEMMLRDIERIDREAKNFGRILKKQI